MRRWIAALLVLATAGARIAHADSFTPGELLLPFSTPGWDYSPSAMIDLDGKEKVWWCSENSGADSVKYVERTPGGAWTTPRVVLQANRRVPGMPTLDWEGVHTCDPTVIRGSWTVNGQSYGYAMYYTTERPGSDGIDNRIGAAFSTDGIHWTKYGTPVIHDGDPGAYGSGQSVAWSTNAGAGVATVYTYTDGVGSPVYYFRQSTDGINFGPRRPLSMAGLTLNGVPGISHAKPAIAFAPSYRDGGFYYYMASVCEAYNDSAYGPAYPEVGTARGLCLYRAEGDDMFNGTWKRVLDSGHTKPVEVEPGFLTNVYGYLDQTDVSLYFACSGAGDPNTWELCWTKGAMPPR